MSTTNPQNNEPISPDWKISDLYQKSWELIKKQKVLWIFGMAVAGLGGGGGSNFNFDSNSFEGFQKFFNKQAPPPDTETPSNIISQVLGTTATTSGTFWVELFSSVPTYLYVFLALEIIIFVIAIIIVSFISSTWSNASLIHSIQLQLTKNDTNIRESSEKAFPNIKSLIGLTLYLLLISFGVILSLIVLSVIGFVINKILGALLSIIAVIIGIIFLLLLTITGIWATRIVVLDQRRAWESIQKGYLLAKKKFWAALLLGIVNTIASLIVIGIPVAIMGGFIAGGIFSLDANVTIGASLLFVGAIFAAIFIVGYLLLAGIITAFKASVWTIAYNNIRGKYDGK